MTESKTKYNVTVIGCDGRVSWKGAKRLKRLGTHGETFQDKKNAAALRNVAPALRNHNHRPVAVERIRNIGQTGEDWSLDDEIEYDEFDIELRLCADTENKNNLGYLHFQTDDDDDDVSVLANKSMTLGVHEGSVSAIGNGATATSSSKQKILQTSRDVTHNEKYCGGVGQVVHGLELHNEGPGSMHVQIGYAGSQNDPPVKSASSSAAVENGRPLTIDQMAEIIRKRVKEGHDKPLPGHSWSEITTDLVHEICLKLDKTKISILQAQLRLRTLALLPPTNSPYSEGHQLIESWMMDYGEEATLMKLLKACEQAGILGTIRAHFQ